MSQTPEEMTPHKFLIKKKILSMGSNITANVVEKYLAEYADLVCKEKDELNFKLKEDIHSLYEDLYAVEYKNKELARHLDNCIGLLDVVTEYVGGENTLKIIDSAKQALSPYKGK